MLAAQMEQPLFFYSDGALQLQQQKSSAVDEDKRFDAQPGKSVPLYGVEVEAIGV